MEEDRSLQGWLHQARGWLIVLWALAGAAAVWYFYHDVPPLGDAGAFAGIATHMYNGQVLYHDVFDNKGPGIFFLNQFFIAITGNSPWGIHLMQLLHLMAACCCILWLWNRSGLKSWWVSLFMLPWVLWRFTDWYSYYAGNYSEEYACYYLLFAIWLIAEADLNRQRWIYLVPAGAALCFAILIKEPFVLAALAIAIWAVLSGEQRLLTLTWLGLGALLPAVLFFAYLSSHQAVNDWLQYIAFAREYATHTTFADAWSHRIRQFMSDWQRIDIRVLWLAAGAPLVWLDRDYLVQTRFLPVLLPVLALISSITVAAGQVAFGHYFLPLIFFCLLSAVVFTCWSMEKLYWIFHMAGIQRITKWLLPAAAALLFSSTVIRAGQHFFRDKFETGSEEQERLQVRNKLKRWKTIFSDPQDAGRFYFYTGKSSGLIHPSTYYVYYQEETAGPFAGEFRQKFLESFRRAMPEAIIADTVFGYGVQYAGLSPLIRQNYQTGDSILSAENKKYYIWVRNDKHAEWMEDRRIKK